MAKYDPYEGERIAAGREVGLAQAAAHRDAAEAQAAAHRDAASLQAAAHTAAARTAIAPEMNKQEGLGDIGASYRGGRLDLAATRKASPLIPAGRGPETGTWEDVGGGLQATAGDGTYNRPAHREVVLPTHVIRGTGSTYAGGAPGEEWGSLQRAAQAVNRATGQGEYVPQGGSLAALTHRYDLEKIAAQGRAGRVASGKGDTDEEAAVKYLTQMLLPEHGITDPDDKTGQTKILPSYAQGAMSKYLGRIKTMEDVPGILEQLKPELETSRTIAGLDTEMSRAKMLANYRMHRRAKGLPIDPADEQAFLSGKIVPENYRGFQDWLDYGAPKTSTTQTSALRSSLQAAAAARSGASEPLEFEPLTGTYYGRYTGRVQKQPSLLDAAKSLGKKVLGTPESWQKAYQREQEEKQRWESIPLLTRAAGGPVDEDQPYIIGEKGPEVFVPEKKGVILPDLSALVPARKSEYDEVALGGKG